MAFSGSPLTLTDLEADMSRSVRQARGNGGQPKPEGGTPKPEFPPVTEKDGASNVAGSVHRVSTDSYQPAPFPTEI